MSEIKQKRPNFLFYFIGGLLVTVITRIRYRMHISGVKPKGPALLLTNHTSNEDWKFVAAATFPYRITYLSTYHWFTFKKLKPWLKAAGVIPKYQFATDLESMRKIQYVVQKENGIVFIAPEGTIYANGKLGYISPSIAKMIKFLKVPVYTLNIRGAGLGMAKWTAHKHRCTVSTHCELLFNSEESKTLPTEVIMNRLIQNLSYNEFDYQEEHNITTPYKNLAEGFETMFYKCPHCGAEFKLQTHGNTVECTACHTKAVLDNHFRFTWSTEKQYFDNYVEWYDWQFEEIKIEVSQPDFLMKEPVDYGTDKPGVDNYIKVGHGIITLSKDGWDYQGTFNGETVYEHDDLNQVPLATLKIGLHFELPMRNGHNRVFYPENGLTSMKWHLASRAITELLAK